MRAALLTGAGLDAGIRLAKLCKALGHPARITILRYLATRRTGATCSDIVRQLPYAQSTVSQHLAVLKDAGFVRADDEPPRVRYHAAAAALEAFKREVGAL